MPDQVLNLLDAIEVKEWRLLAWGITDFSLTEAEVMAIAMQVAANAGDVKSAEALVAALLKRRLLLEVDDRGSRGYRSRMAEAVRLAVHLRQLFPGRPWRTSPTLVSDFRFGLQPRRYPRRHRKPQEVRADLTQALQLGRHAQRALRTLLREDKEKPLLLSDFQFDATRQILTDVTTRRSRGVIVGAGTGTGKTLAFYLPALIHLATVAPSDARGTKILALYPRNELLKDQLTGTVRLIRELNDDLVGDGGRKLTVGAFFGPTPWSPSDEEMTRRQWPREGDGHACPYLRCSPCDQTMVWRDSDRRASRNVLHCTRCQESTDPQQFLLTRAQIAQHPPDILFTTTEMLNRQLSDSATSHVFGVGPLIAPPRIVLLDEVHTYQGSHGAQVSCLLRRWRTAIGQNRPVEFVGLSATLNGAAEFFASLTGVPQWNVSDITPAGDFEQEGHHYQLILRGDPVSATSLLSTSIQGIMLMRRMLEPTVGSSAQGSIGRRLFVFTDDLDVTNRLFFDLQDAERQRLAGLRATTAPEATAREPAGQLWQAAERIGHDLNRSLFVGLTSSQSRGVDSRADVVVATASLEVGYDDPDVGAVIQHKAPRDAAAFLQRIGRAGRPRAMRPWSVVVLSDYGRDRLAYQNYDALFEPVLPPAYLPTGNPYVLRIQATFALMDWLRSQLDDLPRGSVWRDLSGPLNDAQRYFESAMRRARILEIVDGLLDQQALLPQLEDYLAKALLLGEAEVQRLLWFPPRAIMTAVLPTIRRRLRSNWMTAQGNSCSIELPSFDHPLPEFVPAQLFGSLASPDVMVVTPNGKRPSLEHQLPLLQALQAFCPGTVSRRFAAYHHGQAHWISPPSLSAGEHPVEVDGIAKQSIEEDPVSLRRGDTIETRRCFRPRELHLAHVPVSVQATSKAQWEWHTQILPKRQGDALPVPSGPVWSQVIEGVYFHLHNVGLPVRIRRFATAASATLRMRRQTAGVDVHMPLVTAQAEPASLGFSLDVDGLSFRFRYPPQLHRPLSQWDPARLRALRLSYFKHRVLTDHRLNGMANDFQRDRLQEVFLAGLTAWAISKSISLSVAADEMRQVDLHVVVARVLEVVFQSLDVETEQASPEEETADGNGEPDQRENTERCRQRVAQELIAITGATGVAEVLFELAQVLWEDPTADERPRFRGWIENRFKATLGRALLETCRIVCPQADVDQLILDLDSGCRPADIDPLPPDVDELWLTETMPGGTGIVEEVRRAYAIDPRRLFRLLESNLGPSDLEIVDQQLTATVRLLPHDTELATCLEGVRAARGFDATEIADQSMTRCLAARGILVTHAVRTGLRIRVLRPGSSAETDAMLLMLLDQWSQQEESLGIEIDARVFAYTASRLPAIRNALAAAVDGMAPNHEGWYYQQVYSLLWPRGAAVRSMSLGAYNPFCTIPVADRAMAIDLLTGPLAVDLAGSQWREEIAAILANAGIAKLVAPPTCRQAMATALTELVTTPLNIGFLRLFPQVEGVEFSPGRLVATLQLREAIQ